MPQLGWPTLPEWAGDSRNSTQSPARRCPGDNDLPECAELGVYYNGGILKHLNAGLL